MIVKKGSTDITTYVKLVDSADGTPEPAITISGIDLQYTRNRSTPSTKVDAVALAATNTAHTDNRAILIDATSSPALYRVDWPDAAFATGVDKVILAITATGVDPVFIEVQLVDYDPEDGVRLGLTALPNAVADAAGGLPISDLGGLDLDTKLANTNEITAARMGALTDWINGNRLDLLIDAIIVHLTDIKGATWATTDSLEAIRDRGDSAWVTGGGGSAPTVVQIRQEMDSNSTRLSDIVGDSNALQVDLADGGRLDLILDIIAADVVNIDGAAMRGTDDAALATVCTEARLAELDAANLPADITSVIATVADILVDTMTTLQGELDGIQATLGVNGAGLTDLGGMSTAMKAQVNVEAKDVINVDTVTLPGQVAPPLAPTMTQMLAWLYKVLRNRTTQTAGQFTVYADDSTTVDAKAVASDDSTTADKEKLGVGP